MLAALARITHTVAATVGTGVVQSTVSRLTSAAGQQRAAQSTRTDVGSSINGGAREHTCECNNQLEHHVQSFWSASNKAEKIMNFQRELLTAQNLVTPPTPRQTTNTTNPQQKTEKQRQKAKAAQTNRTGRCCEGGVRERGTRDSRGWTRE